MLEKPNASGPKTVEDKTEKNLEEKDVSVLLINQNNPSLWLRLYQEYCFSSQPIIEGVSKELSLSQRQGLMQVHREIKRFGIVSQK